MCDFHLYDAFVKKGMGKSVNKGRNKNEVESDSDSESESVEQLFVLYVSALC
jgi:hypothetical protein